MYEAVKRLLLTCLITIDILSRASYTQAENTIQPEVTILQGSLQGFTLTTNHERNISAFLGIPYAQPPIGELRFANPVSAGGWNGTLNATVDGSKCPQISGTTVVGDEDCLYVNVYTPQLRQNTSSSLLPVIVFIHGRRFAKGSSDSGKYGPEYLLDEDIVLVALNYRLGPLGYLSTGDEVAPGNWALKDVVLALKWVQNNVAFFGGDPDQVTLFGHSAGSTNVHLLALGDSTIVVNQLDRRESSTYFYTFDYRGTFSYSFLYGGSTTNYGVSHSDVLLYLFPPETSFADDYGASVSETDLEMVDIMVQLKTSFAIDGIPKCTAFDGWEPYSTEGNYLKIGNESDVAVQVQYAFFKERMEFWAALESASATINSKSFSVIFIPCSIFILSTFNQ